MTKEIDFQKVIDFWSGKQVYINTEKPEQHFHSPDCRTIDWFPDCYSPVQFEEVKVRISIDGEGHADAIRKYIPCSCIVYRATRGYDRKYSRFAKRQHQEGFK